MVSIAILLMPVTLVVLSTVDLASAAGNVTINNFTCNVTKGTVPLEAKLTANVTGEVTKWLWEFYNPQIDHWSYSTYRTTGHTFGRAGAYGVFNVTLVVSGPGGNDSLKKIDYVVANKNTTGLPVAEFSASSTSGNAPLNVTFTDNSKNATSRLWYFGLKNTSKEGNPTFNFTYPGTFRVVLEVSNSRGWDATAQEIIVQGIPQENVLPIADFETGSASGLTVQFLDLSENANTHYWDFGDGTTSAEFSPAHTYPSAANYTVNLTVSNANGTASKTAVINVLDESSSSDESDNGGSSSNGSDTGGSSSGGSSGSSGSSHNSGGGGGVSPELQSNVEAKEISQVFISNGNPVKFDFPQDATPVVNISFDSKKTVGKTATIAEMLKNKSTLVSEPPSDELYKYLNIWVGNSGYATPNNIENAVVCFKVEKSWPQNKSIDQSSIALNRYSDKKWNPLPTNLSGEDDKYLYFTAETPGFSPFAVTGKITANEAVNETQSQAGTQGLEQNNVTNATNVEQTPKQTESTGTSGNGNKKTPGFEIVYGIVSLFAVLLHKRK
jgi:PGF-pre-PGF domain-containing protein